MSLKQTSKNQVVRRGDARWGTCLVGPRPRGPAAAKPGWGRAQARPMMRDSQQAGAARRGFVCAPACPSLGLLAWLASCHCRNEHSRQLQYQRTTPQDPWRPRRFFFLSPSGPSVSSTGRSSRVYCMILSADTDTFSFRKTGLCFY